MIRAVLFDIDDTLYPYAPCNGAGEEGMRAALSAITGTPLSAQKFAELLSAAKRHVKTHTAGTAACHNRMLYSQRLCELCGCFSAAHALTVYNAYWDAYLAQMQLFDGALALLQDIRSAGVKLGFCTDLTAHIQMRKLVQLGIADIADAMVTSEESGAEKPDPRSYRLLLQKLGVSPKEAVMIGDDYRKDILGAQSLGIHTIQFGTDCRHVLCAGDFRTLADIVKGMMA